MTRSFACVTPIEKGQWQCGMGHLQIVRLFMESMPLTLGAPPENPDGGPLPLLLPPFPPLPWLPYGNLTLVAF